jgi:hypothetical protein
MALMNVSLEDVRDLVSGDMPLVVQKKACCHGCPPAFAFRIENIVKEGRLTIRTHFTAYVVLRISP